jgi:hypothetical protein
MYLPHPLMYFLEKYLYLSEVISGKSLVKREMINRTGQKGVLDDIFVPGKYDIFNENSRYFVPTLNKRSLCTIW